MADHDLEELHTPHREWRGWIRNRMNHELDWCIITAGLMGVFHDPEADQAKLVLNLSDFDVKPLCEGAKRGSHAFTYVDDCYSVKFVSTRDPRYIYTYGAETEEDFKSWYHALTGKETTVYFEEETQTFSSPSSTTSASAGSTRSGHAVASRTDSGLGDDTISCASDRSASPNEQGGRSSSSYKNRFDSIEEVEVDDSGGVVSGSVTAPGKSGSSDSLSDSGHSNSTTPESELADDLPTLRGNAHLLREVRTENSRFSAPVGEFTFWEEGSGRGDMLTKTYSLPPSRARALSNGEEEGHDDLSTKSSSVPEVNEQRSSPSKTTPERRPGQGSSHSDPARKKLGSRMTVKASKLMGRMAQLRSQRSKTPIPRSSIVVITIEGDLLRKHKTTIVPCFCVLSGSILYSFKSKDTEDVSELTIDITKYKLSKLTAANSDSKELDCAFVLTAYSGSKEHVFIAKDLNLARKWYGHLEAILKELEARQIHAMQSSAPDLRGLPTLNYSAKSPPNHTVRYTKSKTRGSTFRKLAEAEEEKRSSIAARMSRGSFLDAYGSTEEASRQREVAADVIGDKERENDHEDDDDAFIEITMDDVIQSKSALGDRAVSRSMDDLGSMSRQPRSPLSLRKIGGKSKRHRRTAPVPASEVGGAVRTGYLDLKKSGSWKRCWLILTSERLYVYRKPTDSQTFDIIHLADHQVQAAVVSSNSIKAGCKFAFELYHSKEGETQFVCETLEERSTWMAAIGESCKKAGNPIRDLSSDSTDGGDKLSPSSRVSPDQAEQETAGSDGNKASPSSSETSDGSPIMDRRKQIIEEKYDRVKEAQEMEMLRVNTILNQRRMSADVKINAVERQLLQQRKQRKRKKNVGDQKDEEEALLQEELDNLRSRLTDIERESQETNLKQEERLRGIQNKKDVEVRILEQERKLQKHRKAAQQALQQIVKGISAITPPVGAGRPPRFDLISEEGEEEEVMEEQRKMSLVSYSSSSSVGSLCEPRNLKLSTSEPSIASESLGINEPRIVKTSASTLSVSSAAMRAANQRKRRGNSGDSGTDSSSSSTNSPEVPRHEFNLAEEIGKCLPSTDEYGMVSRDKSKSFDSGIADEVVDVNSNKTVSAVTTNGHIDNESALSTYAHQTTQLDGRKPIRTEVSEDVLRDIEEFERIARRALEQAAWMV